MKAATLKCRIKQHDWWIEESPSTHQTAEWAWHGFIESAKHFDRRYLTVGLFFYMKGFVSEVTPREEKIEQFLFALRQYRHNASYILQRKKRFAQLQQTMLQNGNALLRNVATLPRQKLSADYRRFAFGYRDVAQYSVFVECADPYSEDILAGKVKQALPTCTPAERQHIASVLSISRSLSFMEKERISFYHRCLASKKGRDIDQQAKNLSRRYFWIKTHYGAAVAKTPGDYRRELLQTVRHASVSELRAKIKNLQQKSVRLQRKRKALLRRHHLPKELQATFSLLSIFSSWVDSRKEGALQATFIIYRFLEHLSPLLRTSANLLAYTTYDELAAWIATDAKAIPRSVLVQRRKCSVYVTEPTKPGYSKGAFIVGKPARRLFANLIKTLKTKTIQGTVAFAQSSSVQGTVSRVLNTSTDSFRPGAILVATMTRPDFLPFMRKAKAIITDEGGLTCHAAIIARELHIPCIIGTRVATRRLRSGDKVRMDLHAGTVEKL